MEGESSTGFTSTESSISNRAWFDIFLPIMVLGFVLLLIVACYGSIVKLFQKCKKKFRQRSTSSVESCDSSSDSERRNSSRNNSTLYRHQYTNSLPVIDDFQVFSVCNTVEAEGIITEKLPTYEEFMTDQTKEKSAQATDGINEIENAIAKEGSLSIQSIDPDSIEVETEIDIEMPSEAKEHSQCPVHLQPPPPYSIISQT